MCFVFPKKEEGETSLKIASSGEKLQLNVRVSQRHFAKAVSCPPEMGCTEREVSLPEQVTKKGSGLLEPEAGLHKIVLCAETEAQSNDSRQCLDSEFNRVGMGVYAIFNWANTEAVHLILMDGKGCSLPPSDEWPWPHHICLLAGSNSQVSDNEGLPNQEVKRSSELLKALASACLIHIEFAARGESCWPEAHSNRIWCNSVSEDSKSWITTIKNSQISFLY